MTLIACIVGIGIGWVLSLVLRSLSQSLSSMGSDNWGYYFSGSAFAVTLAMPPTLSLLWASRPPDFLMAYPLEQLFRTVFPALVFLFCAWLVVAKRLRITSRNPVVMGAICAGATVLALGLNLFFGKGYETFGAIVLVGTVLAILPSSLALGRVHANFEPQ